MNHALLCQSFTHTSSYMSHISRGIIRLRPLTLLKHIPYRNFSGENSNQTVNMIDESSWFSIKDEETKNINKLLIAQKYEQAISKCKQILQSGTGKDDLRVSYMLAHSFKLANHKIQAIHQFSSFVSIAEKQQAADQFMQPLIESALMHLAELQWQTSARTEGLSSAEKAVQLNANLLQLQLVEEYIHAGQTQRGIAFLEKQLKRLPQNDEIAYLLGYIQEVAGKEEEAISAYLKAIEISGEKKNAKANMQIGMILKRRGDFESSACYLMHCIEADENNYQARFHLGQNFRLLGDGMLGKEQFEVCLKLQPNNPLPYFDLALCYEQIGQIDKCIEFLEKNVQEHDNHQESFLCLANIFASQNKNTLALKYIKMGIESDEYLQENVKCEAVLNALKESSQSTESKEKLVELFKDMEEDFVKENPQQKRWYVFGFFTQLFLLSGRIDLAILCEKRLLIGNPNALQLRVNLATLYRKTNQFNLAIQQYEDLQKLLPEEANYYYFCGQIQLQAGFLPQAIESYLKALTLQEGNDYCLFELSHCYSRSGQTELSDKYKRTLVEYFPNFFSEEKQHIKFIQSL